MTGSRLSAVRAMVAPFASIFACHDVFEAHSSESVNRVDDDEVWKIRKWTEIGIFRHIRECLRNTLQLLII